MYFTHTPALIHAITLAGGAILELGAGHYSTPVLHATGRTVVTIENKPEWMEKFTNMRGERHEFHIISDWMSFLSSKWCKMKWGVVFIDFGKPMYNLRGDAALALKDTSQIIVCHDSQTPRHYHYDKAFPEFKYRTDYKRWKVWTTLLSDFQSIPEVEQP